MIFMMRLFWSLDFDDFDPAFLKKFIGLLQLWKFDHASGPAGHKVASIKRGKVSRTNKDLELFQKKMLNPKAPMGCHGAVKTTSFKAPGVSLGGSGVSIGGVRSLREQKMLNKKWSISLKFSTSLKESHEFFRQNCQHLVGSFSRQNSGARGLKVQQFWVTYVNKNTKKNTF